MSPLSLSIHDLVDVLMFLALGFAAWGHYKNAKSGNDAAALASQGRTIKILSDELTGLRTMCQMQEKRLWRMEVNDKRNSRQRQMRTKEMAYMEQIVRLAVAGLSMTRADEKQKVIDAVGRLTDELNAYRIEMARANEEWEEDQTSAIAMLDRTIDDRIQRQLDRSRIPQDDETIGDQ